MDIARNVGEEELWKAEALHNVGHVADQPGRFTARTEQEAPTWISQRALNPTVN